MRSCQNDCLHIGIAECISEAGRQGEAVLGSEAAYRFRIDADAAHETQPVALSLSGVDEIPAPPAEADDCCIDHEPAIRVGSATQHVMFGQLEYFVRTK